MFIASSNELEQFVDRLLLQDKSKNVVKILQQEDEKQLLFAKNNMRDKMPKQLQSSKYGARQTSKENLSPQPAFPTMFDGGDKKFYEYVREDPQNMKKVTTNLKTVSSIPSEKSKVGDQNMEEIVQRMDVLKTQLNDAIQGDNQESKKMEKSVRSGSNASSAKKIQQQIAPLPVSLPPQQVRNPFVANNLNFTDQFANSKGLQSKYAHLTITQNSPNITAIAQSSKFQAFSQSVAFPTTVMTGTLLPPRETTFARESKMDVTDVMRYTLGARPDSKSKKPMENPFARPPRRRE